MPDLSTEATNCQLSPIERHYVAQGYVLPPPLTWPMVRARRQTCQEIRPIDVPVALAAGCCAWAVPFVDGTPLEWRSVVPEAEIQRKPEWMPRGRAAPLAAKSQDVAAPTSSSDADAPSVTEGSV